MSKRKFSLAVSEPQKRRQTQQDIITTLRDPSGLPVEWYVNGQLMDDMGFTCAICMHVMEKPHLTPCGHSFCTHCISQQLTTQQQYICPACQCVCRVDSLEYTGNTLGRAIASQPLRCPMGCQWTGTGEKLLEHTESCPSLVISCKECSTLVTRMDMDHHNHHECINPLTQCERCGDDFRLDTMPTHETNCPKLPWTCECCHTTLDLGSKESHLSPDPYAFNACPDVHVECPMGCAWSGSRQHLRDHMRDAMETHMVAYKELRGHHDTLSIANDHVSALHSHLRSICGSTNFLTILMDTDDVRALQALVYMGVQFDNVSRSAYEAARRGAVRCLEYVLSQHNVEVRSIPSIHYLYPRCIPEVQEIFTRHGYVCNENS